MRLARSAFLRAVTTPKRGIGHATLGKLGEFSGKWKSSLFEALTSSDKSNSASTRASNDSGYADMVASLLKQYSENTSYTSKIGSQLSLTA